MAIVSNPQTTISKSVVSAAQNGTTTSPNSTTGTTSSSTTKDAKGLADNFNQFLTLLTTQLQHQDPTSPLDTNQFTQQLVQFSQVEQQLKTNSKLDTLISASGGTNQVSALLGYVGLTATAKSTSAQLSGGKAAWTLDAPRQTSGATIVITDAGGTQVASFTAQLSGGKQTIAWDGVTSSGATAPDGIYQIAVTAKDATGANVAIATTVDAVITGVDSSTGTPQLLSNGLTFTTDQIVAVSR
ncbi:MAG: flagellar hook assembly protein FlgD [Beijerinckiaceae bacterium]|nr:flagellar hook assembly protein FlgD [Beijerinckiaceae bacterium]